MSPLVLHLLIVFTVLLDINWYYSRMLYFAEI